MSVVGLDTSKPLADSCLRRWRWALRYTVGLVGALLLQSGGCRVQNRPEVTGYSAWIIANGAICFGEGASVWTTNANVAEVSTHRHGVVVWPRPGIREVTINPVGGVIDCTEEGVRGLGDRTVQLDGDLSWVALRDGEEAAPCALRLGFKRLAKCDVVVLRGTYSPTDSKLDSRPIPFEILVSPDRCRSIP